MEKEGKTLILKKGWSLGREGRREMEREGEGGGDAGKRKDVFLLLLGVGSK